MEETISEIGETFRFIEYVAQASGNAALARLQECADKAQVRTALRYAYDPFITFGIKKLPEPDEGYPADWGHVTEVLDALARRELTGHAARDAVAELLGGLESPERELVRRILQKDLRFGLGASSINKVVPGLIPQFKPMLAKKYKPSSIKHFPVAVEDKLDGVRVLAVADTQAGTVSFMSRSGKEFTSYDHLSGRVLKLAEAWLLSNKQRVVLDGEMTSGSFLDTVSSARRKNEAATDAVFTVFDILTDNEFFEIGRSILTYKERRELLHSEEITRMISRGQGIDIPLPIYAYSHEDIEDRVAQVWQHGGEGVIVKPLDGRYECKRSGQWRKIKDEKSEDLVVTGAFEGEGKYEGQLGGIIADFKGKAVRVGSGFSDYQRKELWKCYAADLKHGPTTSGSAGLLLNRIVEVSYHEATPDGSLRHPRLKRFRDTSHPGIKE